MNVEPHSLLAAAAAQEESAKYIPPASRGKLGCVLTHFTADTHALLIFWNTDIVLGGTDSPLSQTRSKELTPM